MAGFFAATPPVKQQRQASKPTENGQDMKSKAREDLTTLVSEAGREPMGLMKRT